ncbi:MAG: MFS transporter [Chloroflexota bacterium]|jgi:MFS family permease
MTRTTNDLEQAESNNPGNPPLRQAVISPPVERIFSPDFVFATLANFFNSFSSQMLVATLPVYVISLGGSHTEAGLVSGALAFTALLLRPLIGWITDAWKRRPLILIGTSCYGLASIVYALTTSIPTLLLGRIVHGFGLCCYTTASNAYVIDITPRRCRAEAIGLFTATNALGLIIGPAVGFSVVFAFGFQNLFYFSAALTLVACFVSFFTRERRQKPPGKRQPWTPRNGIIAIDALAVAWTSLCLGLGFGSNNAFISIFAESRGVGNPGLYFTVQAIGLLISRTFSGRLADRRGRAFAIIPGVIAMALGLTLLPMAYDFFHFMISAALFGLGFGTAQPATMALLVDKVRPEQQGLGVSTYFAGFDGGIFLGSLGFGLVSENWGFGIAWPFAAICTLLGLAGLLDKRRKDASFDL